MRGIANDGRADGYDAMKNGLFLLLSYFLKYELERSCVCIVVLGMVVSGSCLFKITWFDIERLHMSGIKHTIQR